MTTRVSTEAPRRPGATPLDLLAVFAGGLIGTTLRLLIDLALPHEATAFAVSTLVVNLVGSFVLGLVVVSLWPRVPGWARVGIGPGMLGSFTTFSALAVSVVAIAQGGDGVGAALSIMLSIGLGMLAAWAGLALGARLGPHRWPPGAASGAPRVPRISEVDE